MDGHNHRGCDVPIQIQKWKKKNEKNWNIMHDNNVW